MGKKSKSREGSFYYSTDPDFDGFDDFEELEEIDNTSEQKLKVYVEKKGRRGKVVTIVDGFRGSDSDLQNLGKQLKSRCGVGGTVIDGIIILQGNLRDRVVRLVSDMGYQTR